MNPDVKAKWLEALRSDEYKQGMGVLCRIEPDGSRSYCCLGVLCDLAVKAGAPIAVQVHAGRYVEYDGSIEFLPLAVRAWSGVGNFNPRVNDASLSALNDDDEKSFAEIADLIEQYL